MRSAGEDFKHRDEYQGYLAHPQRHKWYIYFLHVRSPSSDKSFDSESWDIFYMFQKPGTLSGGTGLFGSRAETDLRYSNGITKKIGNGSD